MIKKKKNKIIIGIFFGIILTTSIYAQIDLKEIEVDFFGFNLVNIKLEKERVEILEKKITGHISEGSLKERQEKLYELLYNNTKYKSLTLTLIEIEKKILKKESIQNILTRIENLEMIAYGEISNEETIRERIKKLNKYFEMEENNVY